MRVEHRTTIIARCPVNNGVDYYDAAFSKEIDPATTVGEAEGILKCEDIDTAISVLTNKPRFQETLTALLAEKLKCKVTLVGRHGRFLTTTTEG